jgi:hypothetical protein
MTRPAPSPAPLPLSRRFPARLHPNRPRPSPSLSLLRPNLPPRSDQASSAPLVRPGSEPTVRGSGATLVSVRELRPTWKIRAARGDVLTVEYDSLRRRWRVDPGGYERRGLADVLGQATGERPGAAWIVEVVERLSVEAAD